jgi:hypothetical protein
MNKLFLLSIVYIALSISNFVMAGNSHSAMYKGLEPEISTLSDTIRILGNPISKKTNNKFIICKYRAVEVAVEKKTGKIGVIIITDQIFKDVNGLMIGDHIDKAKNTLNVNDNNNVLYDKKKKIIYIFNQDNLLLEIVYGVLSK